jgi:hypothetical protein
MRKLIAAAVAASALVAVAGLTASAFTYSQKVVVYCPPSDASGCETIVAALGNADRGYDGTNGTVDLRGDLSGYAVLVIPSLADVGDVAPYALLRDAEVAQHLRQSVLGRRAFWSGTPDQGSSNRDAKNALISRLAEWAGANHVDVGSPGLVVLQDGSLSKRYDWVAGLTGISVIADPALATYNAVRTVTSTGTAIVADAAYTNMAARGFYLPTGAAGISLDAVGQTGTSVGGQIVLMTHPGVAESEAVVWTDKDDYAPGETVVITGSGFLAGETIALTLQEDPEVHDLRTFSVVADETGAFTFSEFAPEEHDLEVRFILTAEGQTSGRQAQTTFTDAITRDATTYVGFAHTTDTPNSISIPTPALPAQAGDVLIAQITITPTTTQEVCGPAGWVREITTSVSGKVRQEIWYRVVTGTEAGGTLHTFTFRASCPAGALQNRNATGHIVRYSGVDTSNPIDVSAGFQGSSSTNIFTSPSVTTTVPNTVVLRFVGLFKSTAATNVISAGTGTRLYSNGSTNGSERHAAAFEQAQASAGSTGTHTSTASTTGEYVTHTVALRPAVELGPTKLAFTTAPHNGAVNACLGLVTVQTQNASSVATNVTSNTTVNLSTNAGGTGAGAFYSDASCVTAITSRMIAPGSNSASFYYKATGRGSGSHELTAADAAASLTSAAQTQTINLAAPNFIFDLSTLGAKTFGDAPFDIDGYAASTNSSGAITFALGSGSVGCSLSGTGNKTVTLTGAATGTDFCKIEASLAADANYAAAGPISQQFNIAKGTQAALTVTGPNSVTFGSTGTATSNGGSGSGAVTFSHGSSTGCSVAGTTVSVSDVSGTCSLTATKAADANYTEATSAPFAVSLNKAATQTTAGNKFATFASVDQVVTLSATVQSTAGIVSEGKVTFTVKSGVTTIGSAVESSVVSGIVTANFTLPGGTLNGVYTIEAAYSNGTNYANSSDNAKTLTINQADAESGYYGDEWIQASNNGAASITLSAIIRAEDVLPANVSGARVTFVDVLNGNSPLGTCRDVRVDITDANNPAQGKATCVWTVMLSKSEPGRTVTVGAFIGGTHKNKHLVGDPDFTGEIVITRNSAYTMVGTGQVSGAAPSSMLGTAGAAAFGMTLSYNNKLTNPQGNASATFVVEGVLYMARSNSLNNFSVAPSSGGGGTSIFSTKASISRWDVATDAWVSYEGNATLQFSVADGGGSAGDQIAITISGKNGGLIYSNNWDRVAGKAVLEGFDSGNVVINAR